MATTALSAGDLVNARAGGDTVIRHLSVIPLNQIATATLNQSTFSIINDELTVDNASAAWTTGVLPGMVVYIGTSGAGSREIGVFRVRATPGSVTELKIAETTIYDIGFLALSDLAILSDNADITIYEDFNLFSVFPKITYSGGVDARSGAFFKDFDIAYTTQNETTPSFIGNLGSHPVGFVDTTTNVFTVAFVITTEVFTSSVSTYLWDMDGGTITVGTTASQNPTATFSQGEYLVTCKITLANGVNETFRRWVIAHNAANPPLNIEISSDRRDMTGRKMRIKMTDSIGNLENGMMAIYWEEASWNGNDIASASKNFVGWVRNLNDNSSPLLTERGFEMLSGLEIMKERIAFGQQLVVKADPANWQEVLSSLSHIDYWVFYLLRYHTTLLTLFDLVTSGLTSLTTQAWSVDRGNIVNQINQSASRVNCNVGQRSDGAIYIARDPQMMTLTDRSAVIERMTIVESDFTTIDFSEGLYPATGQVEGSGFSWDGVELTPFLSLAPGYVGGQGTKTGTLQNQLVSDLNDMLFRTAYAFAKQNNPYQDMRLTIQRNLDFFEPVEQYWVRLTIAAAQMPDGNAFNRLAAVRSVSVSHKANGEKSLTLTLEAETDATATTSENVPIRLPGSGENAGLVDGTSYVSFPTYDATTGLLDITADPFAPQVYVYPAPELPATTPVLYAIAWSNPLQVTTQADQSSPAWSTLHAPAAENVISVIHSSASPFISDQTTALLLWDLTDTNLYYSADALSATPAWALKQAISEGLLIRHASGVAGGQSIGILSKSITSGAWNETFDFTAGAQGWVLRNVSPSWGVLTGGVGWEDTDAGSSPLRRRVGIRIEIEPFTITQADLTYDLINPDTVTDQLFIQSSTASADSFMLNTLTPTAGSAQTDTGSLTTANTIRVGLMLQVATDVGTIQGSGTIINATIYGTGYNPFSDIAEFHYSDDNGDTKNTVTIGAYTNDEGMDMDDYDLGSVIAAADYRLYYTTTYAGAFNELTGLAGISQTLPPQVETDRIHITCIRIPLLKLATQATNNDQTALQFIYGVDAAVSGSTLWGVTTDLSGGSPGALTESDMTPIIDSITYYVVGQEALEAAGANTQVILAFAKPVGGGDTVLIYTNDGGTTWVVQSTSFDGDFIRWNVGSTTQAWVAGDDGIAYTSNAGLTLSSRTGDFSGTALGAYEPK